MREFADATRGLEAGPPILSVVVDTEEEFDWGAGFRRDATSISALRAVGRAQEIFDRYDIHPTYAVDYPVVAQPEAAAPLVEIAATRGVTIGAHLHPWVNPPYEEALGRRTSFAGNLGARLEEAKLRRLTWSVEDCFGVRPRVYKAGRYGLGAGTPRILQRRGFLVDASVCPSFDFSAEGGPDFSSCSASPSWLVLGVGAVLEVPVTAAFVGPLARRGAALQHWAEDSSRGRRQVKAALARFRAVERLVLSPEGFTHAEHVRLTRALLARGVRVFSWTFHSPSLKPGCTPYVTDLAQLGSFLDSFRRYFDYFFGELGGVAMGPLELRERLLAAKAPREQPAGPGALGERVREGGAR